MVVVTCLSFHHQVDQTHQTAAGGERGASLHQSAADAEGDDDKRPGLRGEGTTSLAGCPQPQLR